MRKIGVVLLFLLFFSGTTLSFAEGQHVQKAKHSVPKKEKKKHKKSLKKNKEKKDEKDMTTGSPIKDYKD